MAVSCDMSWFLAVSTCDVITSDVTYSASCSTLKICGVFSILGIIMYISLRKDFTCLKSGCIAKIASCQISDVGFPKVSGVGSKAASRMSARTLLITTLLDAVMYGLHFQCCISL
jgi:hypothetical protein